MPSETLQFADLSKVFPIADGKPKPMQMASSGGSKARILVGDGDPVYTMTLFQFLAQAGYEVVVAENGHDAIAELRKPEHPPVAILDWQLPGMNGLEICERMRDTEKNLYLILYREELTTQTIIDGLEAGADLFVQKSVPPEELLAHVKVGLRIVNRQRTLMRKIGELSGGRLTPES